MKTKKALVQEIKNKILELNVLLKKANDNNIIVNLSQEANKLKSKHDLPNYYGQVKAEIFEVITY